MTACASPSPAPTPLVLPPPTALTTAYLALGDSYTIGEGAPTADRWPTQLAGRLRQQGQALDEPTYLARTSWTTAELLDAIAASGNQRTDYGFVSLLIGVNNQYQNQSLTQYRAEFGQLLATARRYAGGRAGRVLVLSIPDWGRSPYAQGRNQAEITREIDAFNAEAQAQCRAAGVAWVNITDLTRAAAGDASQFTADGLHYTGPQMQRWAERALPVVSQLLK